MVNGKLIRRSLETHVLTVAKLKQQALFPLYLFCGEVHPVHPTGGGIAQASGVVHRLVGCRFNDRILLIGCEICGVVFCDR
jgi:hypothetical protein